MSKKEIAFRCSECSELFPSELVDEILKGKTVLCERCGFPFRSSFSKKDYKDMGSPPIAAPKLKRKQTNAYNKAKKSGKKPLSKPRVKHKQQYRYVPPPKPSKKPKKRDLYVSGVKLETNGLKERIPDRDISNLKKSIRIMNDLVGSPLIIIIGIIIFGSTLPSAIITITSEGDIYKGVTKIILNLFRFAMILYMWGLNYKIIIKPMKNGSYTNLGVDAILLGLISLHLYGLGTFILFEGIFILMYEVFSRHNNLYDMGKRDQLSQEIFAANTMESTIKVMNEFLVEGTVFLLVYSIIPILKKIRDFTIPSVESIGSLVTYSIFFGIALAYTIYVKTKFTKVVRNKPYQEIPEDLLIKNIVFAGFSLFYAAVGILGLLTSITLFSYRKLYRDVKEKLPTIQYVKPESTKRKSQAPTKQPSEQPKSQKTKDEGIKTKSDIPATPSPKKDESGLQRIPVMRVDDKNARNQLISSLKKSEKHKPDPPPGKPPVSNKRDIKDYMDRVFTVLTADMRDRLLKLDIPEDQKWDVIREFVNLKKSQQQKYIDELENVNRVLSEELIKRVKIMKLPKNETNQILKQLGIMDPKEQVQFVEFLELSQ